MSESYQRNATSGAEPGHPVQAPQQQKTADQGISEKAESRPDVAGDTQSDSTQKSPRGDEYPEQKHAGKVGYGPNYAEARGHVKMSERIEGLKEEIKGKVTRNQDAVKEGHDKMTGEAKRRQIQQEQNDPGALASEAPAGAQREDNSAGGEVDEVKKATGKQGDDHEQNAGQNDDDEAQSGKHPVAQAEEKAADQKANDEKLPEEGLGAQKAEHESNA